MEITRKTKILELLQKFPGLEETIIRMAPPFRNLRNPVLRKTVAQMATLEMVARIGGLDVVEMVNTLRRAAGQGEILVPPGLPTDLRTTASAEDPAWISGEPQYVIDGIELLRAGEVPLLRVNELLQSLDPGRHLLLVTDFEPTPMLESMRKQRRSVYHKVHPEVPGWHLTYIG